MPLPRLKYRFRGDLEPCPSGDGYAPLAAALCRKPTSDIAEYVGFVRAVVGDNHEQR